VSAVAASRPRRRDFMSNHPLCEESQAQTTDDCQVMAMTEKQHHSDLSLRVSIADMNTCLCTCEYVQRIDSVTGACPTGSVFGRAPEGEENSTLPFSGAGFFTTGAPCSGSIRQVGSCMTQRLARPTDKVRFTTLVRSLRASAAWAARRVDGDAMSGDRIKNDHGRHSR
jgi:hypothetical protein